MGEFSESLTVRIMGDSRHLDRELGRVVNSLSGLESRLQRVGQVQNMFERLAGQVGAMSRPLVGVSQLLSQIGQQLVFLSQFPMTINVAPAIAGLQRVSQMVDLVMAKLQQMSAAARGGGSGIPGRVGVAGSFAVGPVQQFARGGFVAGPGGVDRVPAMLTAGEFVLQRPVVQALGRDVLDRLNQGRGAGVTNNSQSRVENRSRSDVHHYGGFTFNVTQPVPMQEVLRSIRQDRLRLRTRRG